MPNKMTLIQKYITLLDEVYKNATLTGDLEADASVVRQGMQTNEILIPKMDMDGLGDYDRNTGYADGSVNLEWESKKFNYDRGRRFSVDAMDDEETAGLSFGKLSSEFIRTKVVPELDAWRFATYTENAGTIKSETLTTGEQVCSAITIANNTLDEAEVYTEERYLFITPTLYNAITALDSYKSKGMLDGFAKIIRVPTPRFYSAVALLDGKSDNELSGGYKKAESAKNLNFLIIQKNVPIQYTKHCVSKVITPEQNQDTDNWLFFYRAYGITEVYDNKKMGIYASVSAN